MNLWFENRNSKKKDYFLFWKWKNGDNKKNPLIIFITTIMIIIIMINQEKQTIENNRNYYIDKLGYFELKNFRVFDFVCLLIDNHWSWLRKHLMMMMMITIINCICWCEESINDNDDDDHHSFITKPNWIQLSSSSFFFMSNYDFSVPPSYSQFTIITKTDDFSFFFFCSERENHTVKNRLKIENKNGNLSCMNRLEWNETIIITRSCMSIVFPFNLFFSGLKIFIFSPYFSFSFSLQLYDFYSKFLKIDFFSITSFRQLSICFGQFSIQTNTISSYTHTHNKSQY